MTKSDTKSTIGNAIAISFDISAKAYTTRAPIHFHLDGLVYIDQACIEAFSSWERKRLEKGAIVNVEWEELMAKSRHKRIAAPPTGQLLEVPR